MPGEYTTGSDIAEEIADVMEADLDVEYIDPDIAAQEIHSEVWSDPESWSAEDVDDDGDWD